MRFKPFPGIGECGFDGADFVSQFLLSFRAGVVMKQLSHRGGSAVDLRFVLQKPAEKITRLAGHACQPIGQNAFEAACCPRFLPSVSTV